MSNRRKNRHLAPLLGLLATISFVSNQLAHCQEFEDLNNLNRFPQMALFQRQSQLQPMVASSPLLLSVQQSTQPQSSRPRPPTTGARFGPPSAPMLAQASSSSGATLFAAPVSSSSSSSSSVSSSFVPSSTSNQPVMSNIEQMMKNAIARPAESRQDTAPPAPIITPAAAPTPSLNIQRSFGSAQTQQQTTVSTASTSAKLVASEDQTTPSAARSTVLASGQQDSNDESNIPTTTPAAHDTVYSDSRFASLFARRNLGRKSRLTPVEQVKAKPTLPSFIKSPPDPKQFTASQQEESQAPPQRAITPAASNFAQQRLQNQQNRQQVTPPKKITGITSNSASQANNKRANAIQSKQPQTSANLKATPSSKSSTTPRPISNNPFANNRSPSGASSDPANVIAMARKRLLANNALESAKLKQQQVKPANNSS